MPYQLTQSNVDMLELLLDHEGASDGELYLIADIPKLTIRNYMKFFEKHGLGEYTTFDGMFHFWFSACGREAAKEAISSGVLPA